MPAFNAMTLMGPEDSTKVFTPRRIDANGVATLVVSTGVPVGDLRLTVQRSRTTQKREKLTVKFVVPTMQTINEGGFEVNKVARTAYADLVFSFDESSSVSERQLLRYLVASFLGATEIGEGQVADELVDNLEALY